VPSVTVVMKPIVRSWVIVVGEGLMTMPPSPSALRVRLVMAVLKVVGVSVVVQVVEVEVESVGVVEVVKDIVDRNDGVRCFIDKVESWISCVT
jgi:hypothetical protein